MAPLPFEIKNRVHHVFDNAWPCDCAFFGDMADHDDGDAVLFGECGEFVRGRADLGHGPRCGLNRVQPHGLDGIDDHKVGLFAGQCCQDIAQVGFGREFDGAFG